MYRKLATAFGAAAVAVSTLAVGTTPASAECISDGTIPGAAGGAIAIGSGNGTRFYIDDRDFADLDEDGKSQGIWVYQEANNTGNLERGGAQWIEAMIPGQVPRVNPIVTPVVTLFPDGWGGGSVSEATGGVDPCVQSATPDRIWF